MAPELYLVLLAGAIAYGVYQALSSDRAASAPANEEVAPGELSRPLIERESITVGDNTAGPFGPPFADREPALLGKYPSGPFADYREFAISGRLFYDCPMHVYPVRDFPELKIAVPNRTPEYARLSPESILSGLRALPDLRLLRRLSVFDHPHSEEPWLRQQRGDPLFRIQGEAYWDEDSQSWARIRLYQPTASDPLASILAHEWSHLLWFAERDVAHQFTLAHELEQFVLMPPTAGIFPDWILTPMGQHLLSIDLYASSPEEMWAILGELLLNPTPLLSQLIADANPIRASIFSIALARRLATLPAEMHSVEHAFYLHVLKFIASHSKPNAIEQLCQMKDENDPKRFSSAASVLDFLSSVDSERDIAVALSMPASDQVATSG